MLSTMMDVPLTVTGLMRYGTTVYGDSEVVTCTTDGVRRQSYAQTGARAAQLAGALRELGVDVIGGCCGSTPAHVAAMA